MSLPSCWPVLNLELFTNLKSQIEAAGKAESQEQIQAIVDEVYAQINTMEGAISSQLATLNPILALITAPVNPAEVITWIGNFITDFLGPYILPIAKYEAQLVEIAVEVAAIADTISAIESARPEIHITIPAFPNITCKL